MDAYTKVLQPTAAQRAYVESGRDRQRTLERCVHRWEFDLEKKAKKEATLAAADADRIAFRSIDWHDFVVVEVRGGGRGMRGGLTGVKGKERGRGGASGSGGEGGRRVRGGGRSWARLFAFAFAFAFASLLCCLEPLPRIRCVLTFSICPVSG